MRLEPVGVRNPPGRKESRGYFWVAAEDRACPQKSQASGCPCNPPPALAAPPRKERRLVGNIPCGLVLQISSKLHQLGF